MKKKLLLVTIVFSLIIPNICFAFSQIVAFGDSLSDTGNVYDAAFETYPAFPEYFNGRFSNGPVWVEYLANNLSASLENHAWGGATTAGLGSHGVPGLDMQVADFLNSGLSGYDNALFTVWAGPNDFFQGSIDYEASVDNIIGAVRALGTDVGTDYPTRHILVPNMPDLGTTPGASLLSPGEIAGLTALTNGFNAYLHQELSALSGEQQFEGIIYEMNVQQILYDMVDSGLFDNTTDGSYLVNGFAAWGSTDNYLFWDDVHPTTAAHMLLGDYAATSVPVPAAVWMLGSGLLFLFGIRRKIK